MKLNPIEPTAAIYHDTRRAKKDGKFPVKLRISYDRDSEYFPLSIDLTNEEFAEIYLNPKPKKEYREQRNKLNEHLVNAETILKELHFFSFRDFREKFYGPVVKKNSFIDFGNACVRSLDKAEQVKTAISYGSALTSLLKFYKTKHPKRADILFTDICSDLFNEYESWMVREHGRSYNTVGIYMRGIRAIINLAIEEKEFPKELYPFGKRKYIIPSTRKTKRSIPKKDLSKLFNYDTKGDYNYGRALDFWFLSYQCNGINFRDIACLRFTQLTENSVVFIRNKTKRNKKKNLKPIVVPRTEFINYVIKRYGNKNVSKNHYIFPILTEGMTEKEIVRASDNYIRSVNQYMKRIAKSVGVTADISTYWARHSFTTNVIRDGASLEYASECLGHADIKTTMNYWDGFEDTVKKEFSDKLMDFGTQKENDNCA